MNENIVNMKYANSKENSWCIAMDGEYSEKIKKYLSESEIPEDGIATIFSNAAKTLSYCPNPNDNSIQQKTGIVIGKVQSGKTSNFISLISLAFDNHYDIAIVLGGTNKALVKQNSDRIKEYFHSLQDSVFILNTNENEKHLTEKNISQFLQRGKKLIIVGLKHVKRIETVTQIFKGNSLSEKPVLIIDDEGDEYSLNTQVKKNKQSSTYAAILKLKDALKRHCYVSVTATPQANLLISKIDTLSPDFGVLVPPGNGYCGLDTFHSDDKYTVQIPVDEEPLIEEGIPESLKNALAMFFVACAIQNFRAQEKQKLSMLIHISHFKEDHELEFSKVQVLIEEWRQKVSNKKDVSYQSVLSVMENAYNEYAKSAVVSFPNFNEIEDKIIFAINSSNVHKINGDNPINGEDKFYEYNIYVGGTMLGRGLTIKGLCITYITRTAKEKSNVDTVQQRARWFGYKTKYLDLCRIFAVSKILNEFMEIRDHEEDLWQTVEMTNSQGIAFKNMPRIFALSDNLRPTRASVAETENFTFNAWNKQRIFQDDKAYIGNNNNIINLFREVHKNELKTTDRKMGAPFVILYDANFFNVYNELLSKFIFPETSKLNKGILTKLIQLLKAKNLNPKIDVIWMRDGNTSRHPVNPDTKRISNYFTGRSPKEPSKPATYEGDDTEFRKPNMMQLQIHTIEDKGTGIVSPTLAIYLPNEIISKLTGLVIQKKD